MKELFVLNKYFKKYSWRFGLGILFVILSTLFSILSPPLIRETLDQVWEKTNGIQDFSAAARGEVIELVMYNGILLLVFAILQGVFMFFMRQTIIVMSRHIEYDQKNEIYRHYQKLDTSFYKRNSVGDLMSRISEDVSRVRQYIGPAIMYIINLVALVVMCLWMMLHVSPKLTLYSIAPLPVLAYTIWYVNKIVNKKSERIQAQLSAITTKAQESYSGIRVIKSFNEEEDNIESFAEKSETYKSNNIALNTTEAIYFPAMNLFIGISILIVILAGGYEVIHGNLTRGNIAEFVIYITKLTFPISAIGWTANMITRANVSQRRINEFLHTEPVITNPPHPVQKDIRGDIVFDHVSFTYANTGIQALKDFNLHIAQGQKVCIIGQTASGKSTLSHLLLRMYDTTSGTIRIDGVDIQAYDLSSIRAAISYVPQDVFLFSDTIEQNIAFGNTDNDKKVVAQAAQQAAVYNEIMELPEGFNTIIGERGVMLSGGQKQRISIARALAKNPSILLMDESLSAVDTRTESAIQQNLKESLEGVTTIIITHRIFKEWDFDKIIILEDGVIVEEGDHEQLMALGGKYAMLYQYQSLQEEE
ncbi:MAG: ABC transporter ATP-binding protein/permease [Taibaiella sp.]|nr:ABC transporter ATP-binding protein/permease [Taibaiella sp.]